VLSGRYRNAVHCWLFLLFSISQRQLVLGRKS